MNASFNVVEVNALLSDLLLEVIDNAREATRVECEFSRSPVWIQQHRTVKRLLYVLFVNALRSRQGECRKIQINVVFNSNDSARAAIQIVIRRTGLSVMDPLVLLSDDDLSCMRADLKMAGVDYQSHPPVDLQEARIELQVSPFEAPCAA